MWALGLMSDDGDPLFHAGGYAKQDGQDVSLDFGREVQDNCVPLELDIPDEVEVRISYSAVIPFGKSGGTSPESLKPYLVESMNLLAPIVLREVIASESEQTRRILNPLDMALSSSIFSLEEVGTCKEGKEASCLQSSSSEKTNIVSVSSTDCPLQEMVADSSLCLEVTADILIIALDIPEKLPEEFLNAMVAALEEGRLQDALEVVNPDMELIVYRGEIPPILTEAYDSASPTVMAEESNAPTSFPTSAPSKRTSQQPTTPPNGPPSSSSQRTKYHNAIFSTMIPLILWTAVCV